MAEIGTVQPSNSYKYVNSEGLKTFATHIKSYVKTKVDAIDLSIYIIVSSLPTTGVSNKIYLVVDSSGAMDGGNPATGNVYKEYIWVPVNGSTAAHWELLGQYRAGINLADYYKKTEVYSKGEIDNVLVGKADLGQVQNLDTRMTTAESGITALNGTVGDILTAAKRTTLGDYVRGTATMAGSTNTSENTVEGLLKFISDKVRYNETTALTTAEITAAWNAAPDPINSQTV